MRTSLSSLPRFLKALPVAGLFFLGLLTGAQRPAQAANGLVPYGIGKDINGLVNGAITNVLTPTAEAYFKNNNIKIIQISTNGYLDGSGHALALSDTGFVYAWGLNSTSQLGDTTVTARPTPIQVHGVGNVGVLSGITAIATGTANSMALTSGGNVYTWGYNLNGQLGDNTTATKTTPVLVHGVGNVGNLSNITAIDMGGSHSIALSDTGAVYAWGLNTSGETGQGTVVGQKNTPVLVPLPGAVSKISTCDGDFSLALIGGAVYGWGNNTNGQLGDGTLVNKSTPIAVPGLASGVTDIAAGCRHLLAVMNGAVYSCGLNNVGQLGNGTTTNSSTVVAVTGLTSGMVAVSGGGNAGSGSTFTHATSMALTSIGTVYAWGGDGFGQCGQGSTAVSRTTPLLIPGITTATVIKSGSGWNYVCVDKKLPINAVPSTQAMLEDGTLTFNTANANVISVADADTPTSIAVTLTITGGTVTLKQLTGLTFTAGDGTDDAVMTFKGTIANINLALNGLVYTPTANLNGTGAGGIQIATFDGDTDTDTVTIDLTPVNDEPSFDAIGAQSAEAGTAAQSFTLQNISTGPADEAGQTVTVTASSGTPAVATVSVSGTTVTVTPVSFIASTQTAVITVTVTDSGGTANGGDDAFSRNFNFVVSPNSSNTSPSLVGAGITDRTYLEDATADTFSVTGFFTDPDAGPNGTLTYTVTNNTNSAIVGASITSGGSLTLTPVADAFGTAQITVRATDGGGLFTSSVFNVTITGVNDVPTLSALSPASHVAGSGAQSIALTGISEGPSNESSQLLTITAVSSDPTKVTVVSPVSYNEGDSTAFLSLTPVATGSAVITITVTDDGGTANSGVNNVSRTFTETVTTAGLPPTIGDIDEAASIGDTIDIDGANFIGVTGVNIGVDGSGNPLAAASYVKISKSLIQAVVPSGVHNGAVQVVTTSGTISSVAIFKLLPKITSFSPGSGAVGATVTLTGTGFAFNAGTVSNVTKVSFTANGGARVLVPAADVTIVTNNSMTVKVPSGASTGVIRVANDAGFNESAADFTVTGASNLSITDFTPASGPAGATVTLTGTGFNGMSTAGSTVTLINGSSTLSAPTFRVVSGQKLRFTVPTSAVAGLTYTIKVDNTTANADTSNLDITGYTVTQVPLIQTVTPSQGKVGTGVTISGANFSNVTRIDFSNAAGGKIQASFARINSTTIRAFVPNGAVTGKLFATNGFGISPPSATVFVVTPEITSFTPISGVTSTDLTPGTLVTVTGRSFDNVLAVKFNGVSSGPQYTGGGDPASGWKLVSPTEIRVIVPEGATTGKIILKYYLGLKTAVPLPAKTGYLSTDDFTITGSASPGAPYKGGSARFSRNIKRLEARG